MILRIAGVAIPIQKGAAKLNEQLQCVFIFLWEQLPPSVANVWSFVSADDTLFGFDCCQLAKVLLRMSWKNFNSMYSECCWPPC